MVISSLFIGGGHITSGTLSANRLYAIDPFFFLNEYYFSHLAFFSSQRKVLREFASRLNYLFVKITCAFSFRVSRVRVGKLCKKRLSCLSLPAEVFDFWVAQNRDQETFEEIIIILGRGGGKKLP